MTYPNALRIIEPDRRAGTIRVQSRQCLVAGECHVLEPPIAWRLALELLAQCQELGYPAADAGAPIDALAALAGLIPSEDLS